MLRMAIDSGAELGAQAKAYIDRGDLVPDEIVVGLVSKRIAEPDCNKGFVIDGFPRNTQQAQILRSAGIQIDYVIEIKVDERDVLTRMGGRRVHPASGRVYHVIFNPPSRRISMHRSTSGFPAMEQ